MTDEGVHRLSALFDAHEERLYRLARRLAPTVDDALDLLQETFLKAARVLESIPHRPRDAEAWLVRVLVNIRRDQWRRERVRTRNALPSPQVRRNDDPEQALVIHTIVWRALDNLPPRRRAVVVMHEIEGLDTATIASLLGISRITVRWHLGQGRQALARGLRSELGDFDESPQQPLARRRPTAPRPTPP